MTQRSDSCRRVHLDRECDPEVQLTSAVRLVHAKDQRSKTDVTTNVVYKECSELLQLSLVRTEKWRSLLYPVWRSTPRAWHTPSTLFATKFLVNFHTLFIQFQCTLVRF